MVFQKVFLFYHIENRQGLQLPEVRPSILIHRFQLIIPALGQQAAYRNVHEVLLLFLGKFGLDISKLLYPYEEQNGFHIGFLSKPLHQPGFEIPPAALQIILYLHTAKIRKTAARYELQAASGYGGVRVRPSGAPAYPLFL